LLFDELYLCSTKRIVCIFVQKVNQTRANNQKKKKKQERLRNGLLFYELHAVLNELRYFL
jgi:hypothetical protein